MSQINDYDILPINIPRIPSFPISTTHTIYLRPHAPKIPTEDDSRSLFLVNVPVDSTAAHFRAIFAHLVGVGRFESITFEDEKGSSPKPTSPADPPSRNKGSNKRKRGENEEKPELPSTWDRPLHRSGGSAVVVLVDSRSVEFTLKAIRKLHKSSKKPEDKWPIWGSGIPEPIPSLGSARYLTHHRLRYPDPALLQRNVDAYMTVFQNAEEEKARLAKRARNVPDEEGFITVTKGGRTGPARRDEVELKRKQMEEKERRSREERERVGFYRFQVRERKKAEQGELVKKFEEDRERVRALKERRGRFRPET